MRRRLWRSGDAPRRDRAQWPDLPGAPRARRYLQRLRNGRGSKFSKWGAQASGRSGERSHLTRYLVFRTLNGRCVAVFGDSARPFGGFVYRAQTYRELRGRVDICNGRETAGDQSFQNGARRRAGERAHSTRYLVFRTLNGRCVAVFGDLATAFRRAGAHGRDPL